MEIQRAVVPVVAGVAGMLYPTAGMYARRFGRYELLTTDVDAARGFYTEIFGPEFWGADVCLAPLPDQARARGARPHFRGHLGVTDVEATLGRMLVEGGQQLGPLLPAPGGGVRAGLRDPFGAVLTLNAETLPVPRDLVGWHLMTVVDHERAFALYAELFGWRALAPLDLGAERGRHQQFAWDDSGKAVGSVADLARLHQIHSQWLFYFRVADIERSRAVVEQHGGLALPAVASADGALTAACDDAQAAAFGLYQSA